MEAVRLADVVVPIIPTPQASKESDGMTEVSIRDGECIIPSAEVAHPLYIHMQTHQACKQPSLALNAH